MSILLGQSPNLWLWKTSRFLYHGRYWLPFTKVNTGSLLPWQTLGPFYHDSITSLFHNRVWSLLNMAEIRSLLLWQTMDPFYYGRNQIPFTLADIRSFLYPVLKPSHKILLWNIIDLQSGYVLGSNKLSCLIKHHHIVCSAGLCFFTHCWLGIRVHFSYSRVLCCSRLQF